MSANNISGYWLKLRRPTVLNTNAGWDGECALVIFLNCIRKPDRCSDSTSGGKSVTNTSRCRCWHWLSEEVSFTQQHQQKERMWIRLWDTTSCLCRSPARLLCGGEDQRIDEGSAGPTAGTEPREDRNTKDRWRDHRGWKRERKQWKDRGI